MWAGLPCGVGGLGAEQDSAWCVCALRGLWKAVLLERQGRWEPASAHSPGGENWNMIACWRFGNPAAGLRVVGKTGCQHWAGYDLHVSELLPVPHSGEQAVQPASVGLSICHLPRIYHRPLQLCVQRKQGVVIWGSGSPPFPAQGNGFLAVTWGIHF